LQIANTSADRIFFRDYSRYIIKASIVFRWIVVCGLLSLPMVLPALGLFIKPLPIIITASVIFAYNTIFHYIAYVRKESEDEKARITLYKFLGLFQIILDYITLSITLYFTGSVHTNLFFILIFHLVLGSLIIPTLYLYFLVFITTFAYAGISILELNGIIPVYNLFSEDVPLTMKYIVIDSIINTGILISTLFMTSLLTNKIKRDNLKLSDTNTMLEEHLEAMKALELRKSKFMRYSAHQLRSPLATVISAMNVITSKLVPLDSERAFNVLAGANERAKTLLEIVNSLLELSRIREERKTLVMEDNIDLTVMIEKIIFSFSRSIKKSKLTINRTYNLEEKSFKFNGNISYQKDFDEHLERLPGIILPRGNRRNLRDAFYNLIQNAIKYSTPKGNIFIELTKKRKTSEPIFIIRDEGIGIEPEYIDEIFLEFVRSPNANDVKVEGSGLGLSIAKEIFDAHCADISVESKLNHGSTFTVTMRDISNNE